jgi:hypothetical protein
LTLRRLLFPPESRFLRGRRWILVAFRSLHLLGVAGAGGGYLYGAPKAFWMPYLALTMVSGIALAVTEVIINGVWLIQLCGLAMLAKVILLAALPAFRGHEAWILAIVVIASGISSHAPKAFRHYSVFHRRGIDAL